MFSRFQSKPQGFNSSKESGHSDAQLHNLRQLGLLNSSEATFTTVKSAVKTVVPASQRMPRAAVVGPLRGEQSSFPEKSHSIAAGTIKPPSNRSSTSGHSAQSRDSGSRSDRTSAGMMSMERGRGRRERTFVGSECAVCEEPLEHTLRGEKILQFSCTHVAHEACFFEFMKELDVQQCPTCNAPLHLDTSRGGNVLDVEKITNMVRTAGANSDVRSQKVTSPTPTSAWEEQSNRPASRSSTNRQGPPPSLAPPSYRDSRDSRDQPAYPTSFDNARHVRNDSDTGGAPSQVGYAETTQSGPARRHDYDLQAMETHLTSPRALARNPIPAPTVTVRSEFPTINRSRQQQTLTCLVTVEVSDNKWRPDPDDLRGAPKLPNVQGAPSSTVRPPTTAKNAPRFYPYEAPEVLEEVTENLRNRVDNWHGLDFARFGKLRLYGSLRVGKDKVSWQELECFLFAEMLICVKEKKNAANSAQQWDEASQRKGTKCTLKGSILIKKHLNEVIDASSMDENILTLSLSVGELPQFHLRFDNRNQLKLWQQALLDLNAVETSPIRSPEYGSGPELSETEEEWNQNQAGKPKRVSSVASSWAGRSVTTAPTEYTSFARSPFLTSIHVPIDVVVVVPISSSMQGVKINLVRDALRFMVHTLGERDRMGLVTFGSGGGGVPIVGMTTKAWHGWSNVLSSIKPVGQKSHRADVVEGANVAMDLLMQRKYNNPVATIMLISDASTSDADSVDFVVSRAEAAKITIHSFGLGMTHKLDTMIEMSTRTKASYTYVKDWMMLRECLAGCLGSMQTLSHQNVKLKLKLPEGSPAKFHKISGALQITKRATGRDAEASLGDLRFGDKRDILVQLVILPDNATQEQLPQDAWENIISGLEALGGPVEQEESRTLSVEEVPLIQADLTWGDLLREGAAMQLPRPSLLAITMLPANSNKKSWNGSPPIPPHPSIVQRRMELLTSDMLTRALTLVSRGQHDRAHTLLSETRTILKGLGKGGLPPVPPVPSSKSAPATPQTANSTGGGSPISATPERKNTPSPPGSNGTSTVNGHTAGNGTANIGTSSSTTRPADGIAAMGTAAGIDANTVSALDTELESSLEWINHPAVFGRDSRKAVLQAIGVISSQRAFTFRTPVESLWAARISGVKKLTEKSREWREGGGGDGSNPITEEA